MSQALSDLYKDSNGFMWIGHSSGVTKGNPDALFTENLTLKQNTFFSYPNPFQNRFVIKYSKPLTNPAQIIIYDISGKLIFKQEFYDTEIIIDAKNFSNGIYFCRVVYENQTKVFKIIKSE